MRQPSDRAVSNGELGTPTSWPGSSATNPGRAYARMVTEVFSTDDVRALSRDGFITWSSQLHGILTPYKFWRVADCTAEVLPIGGAASVYSVAFNVSNAPTGDTGIISILNDDYAGVATAILRPKLHPPKKFWAERPIDWYNYAAAGEPAYSPPSSIAGAISLSGNGGAVPGTVIAYLVVELVVEFHTLA